MELNTPQDYIEMALRRKWWIIIPLGLIMIGSFALYRKLPKVYKATTLILVQPEKISTDYVQPTAPSFSDRLATISHRILSRTSLEQVITQLDLMGNTSNPLLLSEKIASMREAIVIDVDRRGDRRESISSFTISIEDENPVNAAKIVNKIASLFIEENLKVREEQTRFTSQFLGKELLRSEKSLKQKEEAIRRFKQQHMGELPDQMDANLRSLEQLKQQFRANDKLIIAAQKKKANLKNQIDQRKATTSHEVIDEAMVTEDPLMAKLNNQMRHLQELLTEYTDQHPDVIAAKANIKKLEAQIREREVRITQEPQETIPTVDPMLNRLKVELGGLDDQINRLKREQTNLKDQIGLYTRRIENTPKREEQMSTLLRDYRLLQENYQSLMDKKIQAQLAENLEIRQKGEQFKILDPATPPEHPFKPDKRSIFGFAFMLGLGLGGGLAFLREQMDRSFYKEEDVEQFFGFPVIATLPRIRTRKAKGNNI